MSPAILRGAEAIGRYIGETTKTTERMCRRGDIPAYRDGRPWKLNVAEYEAWRCKRVGKVPQDAANDKRETR
jgi:hypothetical protein